MGLDSGILGSEQAKTTLVHFLYEGDVRCLGVICTLVYPGGFNVVLVVGEKIVKLRLANSSGLLIELGKVAKSLCTDREQPFVI